MSKKFHVNGRGEPGECTANSGKCPFGDSTTEHFNSKEEARNYYETKKNVDTLPKVSTRNNSLEEISNSVLPIDSARDYLYKNNNLTEKQLSEIFVAANSYALKDSDEYTKEQLFEIARSSEFSNTHLATLNEYSSYAEIIEAVRTDSNNSYEESWSPEAEKILSSKSPLNVAFSYLRKDPKPEVGKEYIEACFPTAIRGLSPKTRDLIFDKAYEKTSADGWGAVVTEYQELANIASMGKNLEKIEKYSGYSRTIKELENKIKDMSKYEQAKEHEKLVGILNSSDPDSSQYETAAEMIQLLDK